MIEVNETEEQLENLCPHGNFPEGCILCKAEKAQDLEQSVEPDETKEEPRRLLELAKSVIETVKIVVFHIEKPLSSRDQLLKQLTDRGIIKQGDMLGASTGELTAKLDQFYQSKGLLCWIARPSDYSQRLEEFCQQTIERRNKNKKTSETLDSEFDLWNTISSDRDCKSSDAREFVDTIVSDAEAVQALNEAIEAEERKKREEEERIKAEIARDIHYRFSAFVRHVKYEVPESIIQTNRARTEARRKFVEEQRPIYEKMKFENEEKLVQIEEILAQEDISDEELKVLQDWLDIHREFGLEEMSDEEYDSFFADGHFFLHSTSFFRGIREYGSRARYKTHEPQFVEALKDGYLIPTIIGEKREERITRGFWPESSIFFDSEIQLYATLQNVQARNGNERDKLFDHLGYALSDPAFPPVVLMVPGQILRVHSVEKPTYLAKDPTAPMASTPKLHKRVGEGTDGIDFGSGNPDVASTSHEISIDLFTMVLPGITVSSKLAEKLLANILEDERFRASEISDELRDELTNGLERLKTSQESISLREFMTMVFDYLRAHGVKTPRLFFYKADRDPRHVGVHIGHEELIPLYNGMKQVLVSKKIQMTAVDLDHIDVEPVNEIPEEYREDTTRVESAANKIRKVLESKKHD